MVSVGIVIVKACLEKVKKKRRKKCGKEELNSTN